MGNKQEWEQVKHRRNRNPSSISTFFVYNIPPSSTSTDLRQVFQSHTNLIDAYIARKKDKYNNPFGFIRFKNIIDPSSFLENLQNKKCNGLILGVYPSRFDKRGNPIQTNHLNPNSRNHINTHHHDIPTVHNRNINHHHHPYPHMSTTTHSNRHSSSYRDILAKPTPKNPNTISIDISNISPNTPSAWKKKSIIASANEISTLENLENILKTTVPNLNAAISYVGGLTILLNFNSSTLAENFLLQKAPLLQKWFSSFDIWDGQDITFKRITEIKIYGVPLSLWDKQVFNKIASTLGSVVEQSYANVNDGNLYFDKVTVLANSLQKINHEIIVNWKHKSFIAKAIEDQPDWVPTFLQCQENSTVDAGPTNDNPCNDNSIVEAGHSNDNPCIENSFVDVGHSNDNPCMEVDPTTFAEIPKNTSTTHTAQPPLPPTQDNQVPNNFPDIDTQNNKNIPRPHHTPPLLEY